MNTLKLIHSGAILILFATTVQAAELSSEKQKFSYAVGFQIAQSLQRDGIDVDPAALTAAIADVLSGKELQVSQEQMQAAVMAFQTAQQKERQDAAKKNLDAGQAYLEKNRKQAGVIQTDSGLQYEVLKKGEGDKPTADSTVVAHYSGTLIDGKTFDSSYERGQPASFPVNGVIQGWQEILPMMNVGSKYRVVIPPELAYGSEGAGEDIGPNQTLVFEIELLEVK